VKLYKLLCLRNSFNINSFINGKCFKILSCDPDDNIINNTASLKTGIANKIIEKMYEQKAFKMIDTNINKSSLISIVFGEESEKFCKVLKLTISKLSINII